MRVRVRVRYGGARRVGAGVCVYVCVALCVMALLERRPRACAVSTVSARVALGGPLVRLFR